MYSSGGNSKRNRPGSKETEESFGGGFKRQDTSKDGSPLQRVLAATQSQTTHHSLEDRLYGSMSNKNLRLSAASPVAPPMSSLGESATKGKYDKTDHSARSFHGAKEAWGQDTHGSEQKLGSSKSGTSLNYATSLVPRAPKFLSKQSRSQAALPQVSIGHGKALGASASGSRGMSASGQSSPLTGTRDTQTQEEDDQMEILPHTMTLAKTRLTRSTELLDDGSKRKLPGFHTSRGSVTLESTAHKSQLRSSKTVALSGKGNLHKGSQRKTERGEFDVESRNLDPRDSSVRRRPRTFLDSLNLTDEHLQTLQEGNFLYLKRRKTDHSTSYDLEPVDHSDTDPNNYYTLSRSGVTHFFGNQSEFCSLQEWEREYQLFGDIRNMHDGDNFFTRYPIWKMFMIWKKCVFRKKTDVCVKFLNKNLFFLNDILSGVLLKVRRLCLEVSKWRLFSRESKETYKLEYFAEVQAQKRRHVGAWVAEFSDDVKALVRAACDRVLDRFLDENKVQADHKMSFMERAALRSECRQLTKFIRLCDFMVKDTLLNMAVDSVRELHHMLLPSETEIAGTILYKSENEAVKHPRQPKGKVMPLLEMKVSVEEMTSQRSSAEGNNGDEATEKKTTGDIEISVNLNPDQPKVKSKLQGVMNKAIAIIGSVPSLVRHEDLTPYTQAASDEGELGESTSDGSDGRAGISQEVYQDPQYQKYESSMWQGLVSIFHSLYDYCKFFEPYGKMYFRNCKTQSSLQEQYDEETSVEEFQRIIEDYQKQMDEVNELPYAIDYGVIRIDSSDLKRALIPSPQNCLDSIKKLLPKIAEDSANDIVENCRSMSRTLISHPNEVEGFVKKVETLEQAQEQIPILRERGQQCNSIIELMSHHGWSIPDRTQTALQRLRDELSRLENGAQTCESKLDEDTKKFGSQISSEIPVLKRDVLSVRESMDDPMLSNPDADVSKCVEYIESYESEMRQLREQAERYRHYQAKLKQPLMDMDSIEAVEEEVQLKAKLWRGISDWESKEQEWKVMEFADIDVEDIEKQVQQFLKTAVRAERGLPNNAVAPKFRQKVEDFKSLIPIVRDLRSDALTHRHWEEIQNVIGHEFEEGHNYTLGELLDLDIATYAHEIEQVSTKAVQEQALMKLFERKVTSVWEDLDLPVLPYKDSKDIFILGSVEDITAALDESLVTINTILGSKYAADIREEVEQWQRKLIQLSDTLDEWLNCQKQWMYLETIFAADDIKRQLAEESKRFSSVDKSWKSIMRKTNSNPKAIVAGTQKGLKEQFARHNETLDGIQKSLEDYLETKRLAFPRFYFLSNEELLDILAQTRDPQAVQPHLRKCFDAVYRLRFGDEPGSIELLAMQSPESEEILLPKNLKARGKVEEWLMSVQNGMIDSLKEAMKTGVEAYETTPRKEWVLQHPGQVVASVSQIMWCQQTEKALLSETTKNGMEQWYQKNLQQLSELAQLVRGELTGLQRKVLVALVTTDVHARDIIEQMIREEVEEIGNFTWQQQLRYYWEPQNLQCVVRQSNTVINYGYEYQGCTSRLVITPLTDRCWMTITGAVNLKLGASPAGPAGTGKTESAKDLAKALGIQCIVFNCSEQIDYMMLGKLFSGLAQSGAWTCLDEFNRIDIEVLSVVAQQLQQLRQAKLANADSIQFEGRHIALKEHCVIITMNPGYAGRTELPDNLKILFRPVAMMVPDYALIAEISLFAEGFDDAKNLSRKMVKLYRLSSEQLSQQKHYDFGMRAVKAVLVMAGALKRASPDLDEDVVLIRAMRDSNVPKFLEDDLPLFHAIVGDLFPGVTVPQNDFGDLQQSVKDQIVEKGLQPVSGFMEKALQLFETLNVRFGVVIVGPTGAGKTTCYEVLQAAMTALRQAGNPNPDFQEVHSWVLNPKSISMGELYGEMNDVTQEWSDGLASSIMRSHTLMEDDSRKWTVFDGPIDALWIENMNTVLDDNMTLCLANGERIKLRGEMRMLFEVADLIQASPATVSRLGVVYMTPVSLGWKPFVLSWMPNGLPQSMGEELREHLWDLFISTVDEALRFVRENCYEPLTTVDIQLVSSLCNFLSALLRHEDFQRSIGLKTRAEDAPIPSHPGIKVPSEKVLDWEERPEAEMKPILESLFLFSMTWTIGGTVEPEGKHLINEWVKGLDTFKHLKLGSSSIYDVFPDLSDKTVPWRKWSNNVPPFYYDRTQPYFSMVVPTLDTTRFTYILAMHVEQQNPVFFTGVTGTGKTVVIQDFLDSSCEDGYEGGLQTHPIVINFSAQTSSNRTQLTIENNLEKKKKSEIGAPSGRRAIIFVDDVNMPAVEEYGAQPPIELLRQFCDFKGFYDRDRLFWKDISDTALVAAAAPPGGGRADVTKRFTRHFHLLCLPPSADAVLKHIFSSILDGFLSIFPEPVKQCSSKAVGSTISAYNSIRTTMKPTPTKSHYTFNLRDVSKVFQGICMIGTKQCQSADVFGRLWAHETCRVFHDRLVNIEDKTWFTELLVDLLHSTWGKKGSGWEHEDLFGAAPVVFVDFISPPPEDDMDTIYEEVTDWDKLRKVLEEALEDYNMNHSNNMDLVFFNDAIQHIARITRILRQPRGNAMLVGVGGSGKQSLTRMCCSISDIECFMIELTRGYNQFSFREDIKKLMNTTGVKNEPLAFLFTDSQIVNDSFLEDINNILNTGEIPSLFETDEYSQITEELRPVAEELGIPATRGNLWSLFVSRVRDNLHIVLAMSPVGDAFRVRCRQFPSLINCTTIDWFLPWPRDALVSVAEKSLAAKDLGQAEDQKGEIAEICVRIHMSVNSWAQKFDAQLGRKVYTTPKSYLDLLSLYLKILEEKQGELGSLRKTLSTGVTKLEAANSQVASLQETLTAQQPVLQRKSEETTELLAKVKTEQEEADKIKEKVSAEEASVRKQKEEVEAVQADAQKDLDVALPALENAIDALNKLDKKDITEVKSFSKPPPAVQTVMEAVCLLLGEKTDWDTAKRLLGRTDFMELLKSYDKDNIPQNILKKLKRYVDDPTMQTDVVSKVSKAATSLCMWCHAMDVYAKVAKEVEPKRQRLNKMNAELEKADAQLKEKQDHLQKILDEVAELQDKAEKTKAEKDNLEAEQNLTRERLERAEELTTGLADEQVRWKQRTEELDEQLRSLTGDMILAAASISYCGPFTGQYRSEMVTEWIESIRELQVPFSDDYTLSKALGDPVRIREWQMAGLPTDSVSTENGILVSRGERWPLMIDPQEQAKKWIKNLEAKNKLQSTRLNNPNMLRDLEGCVRIGRPLLLEDVGEYLDPALEPILTKAIFKQQGRLLVHLGDSDVDYDPNFQLYITTKMPNPHYLPEIYIKVTVINFSITIDGLEDQLLGAAVKKEKPNVEKKKNELVVSMANDRKQLEDLEAKILKLLQESSGNILDDTELIRVLKESKSVAKVTNERLEESKKTQEMISQTREEYRSVAIRGAIIYFVIADLARLDPMYQFSLAYFNKLFNMCIDNSEKSDDLNKRLNNLITFMTNQVYANVCRGLFEAHKLIFSFIMTVEILKRDNLITDTEWGLLLRGAGMIENPEDNPLPDILSANGWHLLHALETSCGETFKGICNHVNSYTDSWIEWARSEEPHSADLPEPWSSNLNMMHKMLILKAFREEKLLFAIKTYVAENLGQFFVESPAVSMEEIYADTDAATPIIFILSVGADPTGMLFSYAKKVEFNEKLRLISLGQGQGPRAEKLIQHAAANGEWVLLQNCHLAKSWLPRLEKIVDEMEEVHAGKTFSSEEKNTRIISKKLHKDFRLFLTSMPAPYFPVPVLQGGVKLTNEPPKGIKANLKRSIAQLESWTPFDECEGEFTHGALAGRAKKPVWKKLAFGLCFFHAVIQERRKFGPLGFNIRYEFNDSDLETSMLMLKQFLEEQPVVPWDALSYVTGHINYGGRVTDDWDRRCLMDVLSQFYTPDILSNDYKFSPSGIYYPPTVETLDELKEYVDSLPNNDPPEIFGMHENANISYQGRETHSMFEACLLLQSQASGGGEGAASDETVQRVAQDIEAVVPQDLTREEAGSKTFVTRGKHMDSLGTVLLQEMSRFNQLLRKLRSSLAELQRAIHGEVLMSDELDRMFTSLLNNRVPENWEEVAYPSLKPLASWVKDLCARVKFLRHWLKHGKPKSFWMSGFFFPQGFMTGTLQNHARKYSIPIDSLGFNFTVMDAMSGGELADGDLPEDGVLVEGLFVDGARWDPLNRVIADPLPGEMYNPLPIVHFMPERDHVTDPQHYCAPLYKTSTRAGTLSTTGISTNYIVAVEFPVDTSETPKKYALLGAALLTQLND